MADRDKLFAYVDETGQETEGAFFLVAVVIVQQDLDELLHWLEDVETATGKRSSPWRSTKYPRRVAYVDRVLGDDRLHGGVYYATYNGTAFRESTITTIQRALTLRSAGRECESMVTVDGLRRSETKRFAVDLRHRGLLVRKVRGSRDESNALVRLADAMAGFARDAEEGNVELRDRLQRAMKTITRV